MPLLFSLLVRVLLLFAVVSRHRALRARRFTTSCWTFVALWLLLLVSKLRLINQVRRDCSPASLACMVAMTARACKGPGSDEIRDAH